MFYTLFELSVTLYSRNVECFQREFWKRDPRENKIDSSIIFIIWFSKFLYSDPLHWHILERICQILILPYPYQWGGVLVLGKQFRRDQFTWLMQWAYCGIREAKEGKVRRNPVGARSLEGLGALRRLGLEGLLLFMYPNFIL